MMTRLEHSISCHVISPSLQFLQFRPLHNTPSHPTLFLPQLPLCLWRFSWTLRFYFRRKTHRPAIFNLFLNRSLNFVFTLAPSESWIQNSKCFFLLFFFLIFNLVNFFYAVEIRDWRFNFDVFIMNPLVRLICLIVS